MDMIELTDWETGEPVYVRPSEIRSMQQLTSEVHLDCGEPQELGRRTRIDTVTDLLLVREDAKTIMGMIKTVSSSEAR